MLTEMKLEGRVYLEWIEGERLKEDVVDKHGTWGVPMLMKRDSQTGQALSYWLKKLQGKNVEIIIRPTHTRRN